MKLTTTADVLDLLGTCLVSAAVAAALESQLFWRLAEQPQTVGSVSEALGIPLKRCHHWLELLAGLGLLQRRDEAYVPSPTARAAILDAYSPETWALLAEESRERYPAGQDLAHHIGRPGSVWEAQGRRPPDYVAQMAQSPERARRFTRMLYEIHRPLAAELAETLDMTGVRRLMDLGGGSGVVSLALLNRHPDLTAVVVDIANVCVAGREICATSPAAERLAYHAADFLQDELPSGFDMVLECDVGIYGEALFRKLRTVLNPGGRLVIVDELAHPARVPSLSRLIHAFRASLADPDSTTPTAAEVQSLLTQAGFRLVPEQILSRGEVVIQAHN
ncbi:MAG: methyltransferase [Bacillota bacterium]|nr:methyltransferase [Bacillota bacterium]